MNTTIHNSLPYIQGNLDALCGVYCLINIIRRFRRLNKLQSEHLFIEILKFIENKQQVKLSQLMKNGMSFKQVVEVFDAFLSDEHVAWHLPFRDCRRMTIDEFWQAAISLLNAKQGTCLLIRIKGKVDHWSVVIGMTDKSMLLSDSSNMKRITRAVCTAKQHPNSSTYIVCPRQTIYIEIK